MMKKFLFFISLLFFIMIPRASATAPENPYLLYDFRSENSLTPYLSSTIEYLTTTECPFSSCNGTYYENLNNLVNGLTSSGYNFFIILARSSTSGYFGDYYVNIRILNPSTSVDKPFGLYSETFSSNNNIQYRLRPEDNSDFSVYNFTFYANQDNFPTIEYLKTLVNSESPSSSSFFTPWAWSEVSDNNFTSQNTFGFYSNIEWSFNLGSYQTTIISDFYDEITTNDNLGIQFNRLYYLWSYIDDNFSGGNEIQDIIDSVNDLVDIGSSTLDSINSSDISGAQESATGFFENFKDNDHGLSAFITAPLNFIKSITNSTCEPITFTLPFTDDTVSLPCMTPIYQQFFGNFLTVWQMITNGIIAYWVGINCFRIVKNMKDPEKYYVEVMGL